MISSHGIIYQYRPQHDEPAIPAPEVVQAYRPESSITSSSAKSRTLSKVLSGVIVSSFLGLFILISPFLYTEARYRISRRLNENPDATINNQIAEAMADITPTPKTIVSSLNVNLSPTPVPKLPEDYGKILNDSYLSALNPIDRQFSVIIPKIGVNDKIIANVDAGNEAEYRKALKQGVAHAKGTYLPGQDGTMYVFAHSTDYAWNVVNFNAVFFLLKDMEKNDQIYVVYKDKVYPYKVTDVKIVDPGDTYYLKPKKVGEELILQTCWPPGTTQKRLLVFAKPGGSIFENNDLSYSR